jgi:hypothetical protein
MDNFFYDLNKKLDGIRAKPESEQLNERDMGKHNNATTGFAALAKKTGGGEKGARIAGAQLAKMRAKGQVEEESVDEGLGSALAKRFDKFNDTMATVGAKAKGLKANITNNPADRQAAIDAHKGIMNKEVKKQREFYGKDPMYPERGQRYANAQQSAAMHKINSDGSMEESAFQAAIGKKKYGDEGMKALQKAGREHASDKTMSNIRNKYDKYDESQGMTDEGNAFGNAVRKAKADGIQPGEKINVGGKQYPVKEADTTGLGEKLNAPQLKKFAKLAPPANKITFADKIAGAKKEVDEMLGDVAADAMRSAVGHVKNKRRGEMEEGWDDMMKDVKDRAHSTSGMKTGERKRSSTGGEIEKTKTGLRHHARSRDHDDDKKADDGMPKRKGRPAGPEKKPERVTAKAYKHKGGRVKEGEDDIVDRGEYDQEGEMAKDDIKTIVRHAQALEKILGDNDNLPEWVQAKLAKIEGMMTAVDDYMQNQTDQDDSEELDEKAVSKKQQRFMGMVHATQKGEKATSKEVGKVAKTMKKKDAEDFASTKQKGLPEKVSGKKEEVEETTTSGSVATAAPSGKAKSGGMSFGKGVYEGINSQVERMITEGMNVSVNVNSDGNKSITVSADGEEAENLAQLLRLAGMHKEPEAACPTCGSDENVSENASENAPDWPTNAESSPNAMQYSGGLNGPKSTGQTTIPVIAGQRQRTSTMEENVTLERSLFKLFNAYKAS